MLGMFRKLVSGEILYYFGLSDTGGTPISSTNPLPVTLTDATGVSTYQETTIASGTVAQDLFASATPANGYEILNPSNATEPLYWREANNAVVGSYGAINPGQTYVTPAGYKPTGRISVNATTTTHPVIGRSW